jgi:protein tyrosine/serine phosphatase
LNGKKHGYAKKLGINVLIYHWSTSHLPPKEELKSMVDFIDKNNYTLVHCAAGSDRTGYAVAFYRIWRQNWTLDAAIKEMEKYGYHPEKKKALQQEMKYMVKENEYKDGNMADTVLVN